MKIRFSFVSPSATSRRRALVAMLMGCLAVPNAWAVYPVTVVANTDPPTVASNAANVTTATTLTALNVYLQTGYTGNGLIQLLSSINDKLGQTNANDAQSGLNQNMEARSRMYDDYMIKMKAAGTPTNEEVQRACVAISAAMTSPQGHGAGAGAADAYRDRRSIPLPIEQRLLTPSTPDKALADQVRERTNSGYCSTQDVKNQFPGCSATGQLPDADIRSSSLTMGATGVGTDPTNGSLDTAQQAAATAFMVNSSAQPPSIPDSKSIKTQSGRAYLVYLNKFAARQSAANDAMSTILASHSQIPVTINGADEVSPLIKNWRAQSTAWGRIFGNQVKFPQTPSESDMLKFNAFKYFSDSEAIAKYTGDKSPSGLAVAQIELQAVGVRIAYEQLERQEQTNLLLAQLLNQQMDPLTRQSLDEMATKSAPLH